MRFIKCFAILSLCLFMGNCPKEYDEPDIDIGDYEYHLEEWNSRNMLDYQIKVRYRPHGLSRQEAFITVRGGIPESNDHSWWVKAGRISTIPEFYSLIKYYEKDMKDAHKSGDNRSLSLKVSYNTEYHYPNEIITTTGYHETTWLITVMPPGEGEPDIDIGDYEHHLEEWNSRNMLDYQISVNINYQTIRTGGTSTNSHYVFNVKNGVSDRVAVSIVNYKWKQATVPGIYSMIKEEEKRLRNVYNGTDSSYLHVQYNTEYHYPTQIISCIGQPFDTWEYWDIMLTPEETE